jgi:hypothetical protein
MRDKVLSDLLVICVCVVCVGLRRDFLTMACVFLWDCIVLGSVVKAFLFWRLLIQCCLQKEILSSTSSLGARLHQGQPGPHLLQVDVAALAGEIDEANAAVR